MHNYPYHKMTQEKQSQDVNFGMLVCNFNVDKSFASFLFFLQGVLCYMSLHQHHALMPRKLMSISQLWNWDAIRKSSLKLIRIWDYRHILNRIYFTVSFDGITLHLFIENLYCIILRRESNFKETVQHKGLSDKTRVLI